MFGATRSQDKASIDKPADGRGAWASQLKDEAGKWLGPNALGALDAARGMNALRAVKATVESTEQADPSVGASAAASAPTLLAARIASGGAGNDVLSGGSENDTFSGGAGDDTLTGGAGNDTLSGGDGYDRLWGDAGNDTLNGDAGNDILMGGLGDDTINAGTGNDAMDGGVGNDRLSGGDGSDTLFGDAGNDVLSGGNGDDTIHAYVGDDVIDGGEGHDVIYGEAGNDSLAGGAGNDTLQGGDGNDRLEGGLGNDRIQGGAGITTIVFGRGDGQDQIVTTAGSTSVLQFRSGVAASDVTVTQTPGGTALELSIAGTSDKISLGGIQTNPLQQVKFSDGTTWDAAALRVKLSGTGDIRGTNGADVLYGTTASDAIIGLAGADRLHGGAGDDKLDGGADNDALQGEAGNDTLIGGLGNDALDGGAGNNTYVFARGDGQDWITSADASLEIVQFGSGIKPADVLVSQSLHDFGLNVLTLSIAGTQDKLYLSEFMNDVTATSRPAMQVKFSDGTTWDSATLLAKVFAGTPGDDQLIGTAAADVIQGQAGIDVLYGDAGGDTLRGGTGNDYLFGEDGNDTLAGGLGDDLLNGGAGTNTYLFSRGDGHDWIAGAPDASGVLQFAAGIAPRDVQVSNTYYDGGLKALTLSIAGTTDRIRVGGFIGNDAGQVYPVQQVKFSDGTTWLTSSLLASVNPAAQGGVVKAGTAAADMIHGDATNDRLAGAAGNDAIHGWSGDDYLYGEAGNDTLNGGAGNDHLDGGTGANTYVFGWGFGTDWITGAAGSTGVLQFAGGVAAKDVVVTQALHPLGLNVLQLSIAGTNDKVQIDGFFEGGAARPVQQVKFMDGTTWDANTLKAKAFAGTAQSDELIGTTGADGINGQGGDDVLYGDAGNDTLNGGAGDDELFGEDGNDTLMGGAGDDVLHGDAGSDTYRFGRGGGQDVVLEFDARDANLDVVVFDGNVSAQQLWFSRSGADLEVSIIGTEDLLIVDDWFTGSAHQVDQFRSGDGQVLLDTQVQNLVQAMSEFDAPAAGQTSLVASYLSSLDPILAANWN
ncbi:calcium-binding protein [Variovorax sp. J22R133]|uniref:calcium-binding protein n=1 Tax=Variovorax brevis TaxID=3053503 RepID=UPI002574FECB|nr:calcium-binding protein [Variovorax sp. J22R133]MDM0113045.1 calcium-binding protein [Variovorax sp. J22R133]